MPEQGFYEKRPRPESIDALCDYLKRNPIVKNIARVDHHRLRLERSGKPELNLFLTNIYTVGRADVIEILSIAPLTNAIVTMSAWNSYSSEAKSYAKENGVGLFKFAEFLGAVYYAGKRFLDYTPPSRTSGTRRPRM